MDDAKLQTVWQQRQFKDTTSHLSHPLNTFMKHTLARRVRQLGQLAQVWDEIIPADIRDHTALESFNSPKGVLSVIVDSAAHRFQLQTLLNGGLLHELQLRFQGAINKVKIRPGQFYWVDVSGQEHMNFCRAVFGRNPDFALPIS